LANCSAKTFPREFTPITSTFIRSLAPIILEQLAALNPGNIPPKETAVVPVRALFIKSLRLLLIDSQFFIV
jgi:hypothetical protein